MKTAAAPLAGLFALIASLALAADAPTPPQRTSLEADYGEFWSVKDETFFLFKGTPTQRVVLIGTNLKLTCDHLEMTAVGLAKGDKTATLPALEKFKYLLATGNVIILQGEREARAGRAEVFPRDDKIVLTEDPVIIDHGRDKLVEGVTDHSDDFIQSGEEILMLRGDRRVIVKKVKLTGPSIKDLGFDKNQPPPKGEPKPDAKAEPKK